MCMPFTPHGFGRGSAYASSGASGSDTGTAFTDDDLVRGSRGPGDLLNLTGNNPILSGKNRNRRMEHDSSETGSPVSSSTAGGGKTLDQNPHQAPTQDSQKSNGTSHVDTEATTAQNTKHNGGTRDTPPRSTSCSSKNDKSNKSNGSGPPVAWAWPGTASNGSRHSSASSAGTRASRMAVSSKQLPPVTPSSGGESASDLSDSRAGDQGGGKTRHNPLKQGPGHRHTANHLTPSQETSGSNDGTGVTGASPQSRSERRM
ncbi:unnamed protein product, partial [Sphacelaria rigidula]